MKEIKKRQKKKAKSKKSKSKLNTDDGFGDSERRALVWLKKFF